MMTTTPIPNGPDPIALAAAQAAQQAVSPDTVILFGSRARGDHRPNSDLDLLIVCADDVVSPTARAKKAVRTYFAANPPRLAADVVPIRKAKFDYCRRAKNHVAGQALRDGIIMSGEKFDSTPASDAHPDSWPDVKERLQAAYRHLGAFIREIEHPDGEQEIYGFQAQQAIENAIKAWLSAANLDYRRVHDLIETAETLLNDPGESNTLAAAQLRLLMDYTSFEEPDRPGEYENWLTLYAVAYRYGGTAFRMDDLQRSRFRREITLAAGTFINRAYALTGTGESDVRAGQ